jgi:hypothetical protein
MTTKSLLRLSLRGVLAWCVLSAAGFLFAPAIMKALSPLMVGAIDIMQSDFMAHLAIVDERGGAKIAMSCTAARELILPQGKIVPFLGSFNCAATDAIHALVPFVIFSVGIAGWPISHRRELLRRLVGFVLLLPVVAALTTPVLLVGLVESRLHPDSFSAAAQWRALAQPWVFMEMGGRWLLPLLAALLCIRLAADRDQSCR